MLQRFRRGLGVFSNREVRKSNPRTALLKAAAGVFAQAEVGCRPMVERLESRELLSSTWYVSPGGSNSNSGSLSAPFKTIQRAASVAGFGDHVEIETGTYHETVVPHSGTIFQAYKGENVTVSGADPISGWTQHSGSIYSASMPSTLGMGNDQVFDNGVAMKWAEFPNTPVGDWSSPVLATMQSTHDSGSTAVIYDSALNQGTNFWAGASIHMDAGQAWIDETGTVVSSAPGSITVRYTLNGGSSAPKAGNKFQLYGTYKALDTAGEWYRDPSTGKLNLWAPNGGSPNGQDVEVKTRKYAFDLGSSSSVTIQGIHIFAASIRTTSSSHNVVLNGITAMYISQFSSLTNGWAVAPTTSMGINLMGSGDILENSTIAYATGDGVYLGSPGVTVTNNVIHDVDSIGGDMAGVRDITSGNTISHNTIYNTGRDGIEASVKRVQILYNVIHNASMATTEGGGIYTQGSHGSGATIAYNYIYDIHSAGWGTTGLFLDNNTSGWTVHNNIVSNVDYALKFNETAYNNNIYNNTLEGNLGSVGGEQSASWAGTVFRNNILVGAIRPAPGAKWISNSTKSVGGSGAGSISAGASGAAATVASLSTVVTTAVTTAVTT